MEEGDWKLAEIKLIEACAIIPEVDFFIQRAAVCRQLGKQDEADALLAEVLQMLEDDVANGHDMTMAYAELYRDHLKDLDKALAYARVEYDARPTNIDVNRLMASIYLKQGEVEKAKPFRAAAAATGSRDPGLLAL